MLNSPKISIITVVYNSELYISETIESVINQDYSNYEYIIIDGGSHDSTISIIEKYREKIHHFISEKDYGIFFAMNKGLNYVTGEWVIFINSGDMFYSNKTISDVFSNSDFSNINLIYGNVNLYNSSENYFFSSKTNKWKINLNAICHQSVFIRREAHQLFDTTYKIAADHALIYQLIKLGKIYYCDRVISRILIGGVSSNLALARMEKFKISIEYGSVVDVLLASLIFTYNLLKEISKLFLVKLFPFKVFQVVRHFKNQIEQL